MPPVAIPHPFNLKYSNINLSSMSWKRERRKICVKTLSHNVFLDSVGLPENIINIISNVHQK